MPKKAKYEISASTHGHDDDGIIHLDITRTIDSESKTERFEIAGFKKNPIPSQVTIGNYKINTKIKNSDLTIADVIKQLKEAQTRGFEELIKKLNELVGIEKINKNNSSSFFAIETNCIWFNISKFCHSKLDSESFLNFSKISKTLPSCPFQPSIIIKSGISQVCKISFNLLVITSLIESKSFIF